MLNLVRNTQGYLMKINKKNKGLSSSPLISNLLAIFLMWCAILAIYSSILLGHIWLKWDMYNGTFPLAVDESTIIQHGNLPLWEPFLAHGVPFDALLGYPVYFPLTIVFSFLGYTQVLLQVQFIFIILLAGLFAFLAFSNFVRNYWLRSIGGVVYSTCGLFIGNAEHITFLLAAMLYPLLHFSVRKWLLTRKTDWSILIGVALGLLILDNYPPFFIISILFIILEILMFVLRNRTVCMNKRFSLQLLEAIAISSIIAFGVSLISLYPDLAVISQITRGSLSWQEVTQASLNFWNWVGSLSPVFVGLVQPLNAANDVSMGNVYVALPILVLAISVKQSLNERLPNIILVLLAFLLSLGRHGSVYFLIYKFIPGMDSFRFPSGLRYFVLFYVIIISLDNLEKLIKDKKGQVTLRNTFWISSAFMANITLAIIVIRITNPLLSLPVYTVTELEVSFICLLLAGSLFYRFGKKALPSFFFIVVLFSGIGVIRNQGLTLGTATRPEGYQSQIKDIYKSNIMAEVSNRIVPPTQKGAISETIFSRQFQTGGYLGNFELKSTEYARTNKYLPIPGDKELWLTSNISLQRNAFNSGTVDERRIGPENINVGGNTISAQIDTITPLYVVLEQTPYPGWMAKIDGKNTPICSTSWKDIAVKVPSGRHEVSFIFRPIGAIFSAYISFFTWCILILYLIYKIIFDKKKLN